MEKTGITSGSLTARRPANPFANDKTESQWNSNSGYSYRRLINDGNFNDYKLQATRSSADADEGPMDVYMVALDSHFNSSSDRHNKIAEVIFDREIIGILIDDNQTMKLSSNTGGIDMHNPNNNTYPTSNANDNRSFEDTYWRPFKNDYTDTVDWEQGFFKGGDWLAVGGTDNRILHVGAKNTGGGDYVRVLVKGEVPQIMLLPHQIQQYTLMKTTKSLQQEIEHHLILQKYLQQVILIFQTVMVIVYQKFKLPH